jgi:hypothetical protein
MRFDSDFIETTEVGQNPRREHGEGFPAIKSVAEIS